MDAAPAGAIEDPAPPPGEQLELSIRLGRMIQGLSDGQRSVVTMFYFERCSVDEISAALRMPTGTVKTHLSRARAALRDAWRATERP
jgi:RNA polymerase sigma-70 factor (ECF subfamily)